MRSTRHAGLAQYRALSPRFMRGLSGKASSCDRYPQVPSVGELLLLMSALDEDVVMKAPPSLARDE